MLQVLTRLTETLIYPRDLEAFNLRHGMVFVPATSDNEIQLN